MQNKNVFELFEQHDIKCTSVGKIDAEKVAFLQKHCPDLFKQIKGRTIIMWKDRIEHLKKHGYETENVSVEEMCSLIPEIIEKPDYLGVRKKDLSIQFIKRYSDNMLVAVRMDNKGKLLFRTMYTITESQLSDYLRKGSAWEFVLDK